MMFSEAPDEITHDQNPRLNVNFKQHSTNINII